MGLLQRIFGGRLRSGGNDRKQQSAIERYRYLLRTTPPEALEEAHAEAFAALTPEQRRQVQAELATVTPEPERPRSDDPSELARVATRAEMRRPGTLERSFGGAAGMGPMLAGSLLAGVAGSFVGTAVASAILSGLNNDGGSGDAGDVADDVDPGMGSDWNGYGSGDFGGAGDFGGGF